VWTFSRLGGAMAPLVLWWLLALLGGWAAPLGILAALGLLWSALFWRWFRNRPEEMAGVSEAERELIACGRPASVEKPSSTPWGRFLVSRNVWALCLVYGFVGFSGNFITSLLPI